MLCGGAKLVETDHCRLDLEMCQVYSALSEVPVNNRYVAYLQIIPATHGPCDTKPFQCCCTSGSFRFPWVRI